MASQIDLEAFLQIKSLQSSANPESQHRILSLLESLASFEGALFCWDILLTKNENFPNIHQLPKDDKNSIVFLCFRGIESFLSKDQQRSREEAQLMKNSCFEWISYLQNHDIFGQSKTIYLKKTSQLFVLTVLCYYPTICDTLFVDFVNKISPIIHSNICDYKYECSVQIFFEVLYILDPYLVSRDVQLVCDELNRSTLIKDELRATVIPDVVQLLIKILAFAFQNLPDTASKFQQCLDLFGLYLTWIDVRFVANDDFLQLIKSSLISSNKFSESSFSMRNGIANFLFGLIKKGMPNNEKELIFHNLWSSEIEKMLIECPLLAYCVQNKTYNQDSKMTKCFHSYSNLAVYAILQLVELLKLSIQGSKDNFQDRNFETAFATLEHIELWVDFSLHLLSFCDPVITLPLLTALREYICFLKPHKFIRSVNTLTEMNEIRVMRLKTILNSLINNMKYDPNTDEEDSQFQETRNEIRSIITNIAQLDASLVLHSTYELIHKALELTIRLARNSPNILKAPFDVFATCEISLSNFYHMGEALKPVKGDFFAQNCEYRVAMMESMQLLCCPDCLFSAFPDSRIQLLFFEVICRFDSYFLHQPDQLSVILASFFDERGLRNPTAEVRNRCAYLLSRLVKNHKRTLAPAAEQIINQLGTFLESITEPVVPPNLNLEGSSQVLDSSHPLARPCGDSFLGPVEQGHLYEAAAQLLLSYREASAESGAPTVCQLYQMLMQRVLQLLEPKVTQIHSRDVTVGLLLAKILQERDESWLEARAQLLRQTIELIVRTTKVFNTPPLVAQSWDLLQQVMELCNAQVILYLENVDKTVSPTAKLSTVSIIWAGTRAFHHRIINVCTEAWSTRILDLVHLGIDSVLTFVDSYCHNDSSQLLESDWPLLCGIIRDTLPLICQIVLKLKDQCPKFLVHYHVRFAVLCMQLTRRADTIQSATFSGSSRASPVATTTEACSTVSQHSFSAGTATPVHILEDRRLLLRNLMRLIETIALTYAKNTSIDLQLISEILGSQHATEFLTYVVEQAQFCLEHDEPMGLRSSFIFFHTLLFACASLPTQTSKFPLDKNFILNLLIPLIIHGPGLSSFRLQDPQYLLALDEFALTLIAAYMFLKEDLMVHLQDIYFPRLQMPNEASQSFLQALHASVGRAEIFQKFFRQFYNSFR